MEYCKIALNMSGEVWQKRSFASASTATAATADAAKQWRQTAEKIIGDLRAHFPQAYFYIDDNNSEPVQADTGISFLLSHEFIRSIGAQKHGFSEGRAIIQEAYDQYLLAVNAKKKREAPAMNHSATRSAAPSFALPVPQQSTPKQNTTSASKLASEKKAARSRKKIFEIHTEKGTLRIVIAATLNYRPGKDLTKLARASSIRGVKGVINGLYAQIGQTRKNRFVEQAEIKSAIAQMNRVVQRARAKIRHLESESIMEKGVRKAIQQKKLRQAVIRKRLLDKTRRDRRNREYAQIKEHMKDALLPISNMEAMQAAHMLDIAIGDHSLPSGGTESMPSSASGVDISI